MRCKEFDPADITESEFFGIDFVNDIAAGDSVLGVESFTIELINGYDPNYLLRISGAPSNDGTLASCRISNLQPGCRYRLIATVSTALGNLITLWADVLGEEF